jgi:hypothetical protein
MPLRVAGGLSVMSGPLTKDSVMECKRHGIMRPASICRHLQFGIGLGFHEPDHEPAAGWPFRNAWCAECERVARREGGWNDTSESFAGTMAVCEGCLEEIRQRNT